MSIPRIYGSISAVSAELAVSGIAKTRLNSDEQYAYRGIDDIYDRLSPLLAKHKLCILPRVLDRICVEKAGADGSSMMSVSVKAAFHLVNAEDGSCHVVETFGEALDAGDKGTSKAMTAAYKYAVLQTFCIPISGNEDADAKSPRLGPMEDRAEPVQGWDQWARDIAEMVCGCESVEAVDRVQDRQRTLLAALRRERPELYASLGETFCDRRAAFDRRKNGTAHGIQGKVAKGKSARSPRTARRVVADA